MLRPIPARGGERRFRAQRPKGSDSAGLSRARREAGPQSHGAWRSRRKFGQPAGRNLKRRSPAARTSALFAKKETSFLYFPSSEIAEVRAAGLARPQFGPGGAAKFGVTCRRWPLAAQNTQRCAQKKGFRGPFNNNY
jgi:hypothetical protein